MKIKDYMDVSIKSKTWYIINNIYGGIYVFSWLRSWKDIIHIFLIKEIVYWLIFHCYFVKD